MTAMDEDLVAVIDRNQTQFLTEIIIRQNRMMRALQRFAISFSHACQVAVEEALVDWDRQRHFILREIDFILYCLDRSCAFHREVQTRVLRSFSIRVSSYPSSGETKVKAIPFSPCVLFFPHDGHNHRKILDVIITMSKLWKHRYRAYDIGSHQEPNFPSRKAFMTRSR